MENSDTTLIVNQLITHADQHTRTSTTDRAITEYQRTIGDINLTYFHTLTKTTLTLARRDKAPTRQQITAYRKLFNVPEWAKIERPTHPIYHIVRITWNRAKQKQLPITTAPTTSPQYYQD